MTFYSHELSRVNVPYVDSNNGTDYYGRQSVCVNFKFQETCSQSIPGENPDLFRADTIFWTLETLAALFALFAVFAPRLLAAAAGMLYENFLAELEAEVVLLLVPRLAGVRLVLLNWQQIDNDIF